MIKNFFFFGKIKDQDIDIINACQFTKVFIDDKFINFIGVSHFLQNHDWNFFLNLKYDPSLFLERIIKDNDNEKGKIMIYLELPIAKTNDIFGRESKMFNKLADTDPLKMIMNKFYDYIYGGKKCIKSNNQINAKFVCIDQRIFEFADLESFNAGLCFCMSDLLVSYFGNLFNNFNHYFFPKCLIEELFDKDVQEYIEKRLEVIDFIREYIYHINYNKEINYDKYYDNVFITKCLKPFIEGVKRENIYKYDNGSLKHKNYLIRKKNDDSVYAEQIDDFFDDIIENNMNELKNKLTSENFMKDNTELIESIINKTSNQNNPNFTKNVIVIFTPVMDFYAINRLIYDMNNDENKYFYFVTGGHHTEVFTNFFSLLENSKVKTSEFNFYPTYNDKGNHTTFYKN